MDLEMVLNELSLSSPLDDVQTARQLMSDLVGTVQMAESRHKVRITLITHRNLPALLLAPGYPLARWWGDRNVDERVRRLFITLVAKGPYIDDITESGLEEFLYQKDPARGLGCAFQHDALALSLRSDSRWYPSRIELSFVQLDDNGEIIEEVVEVIHASRNDHVLEHADWIKNRIQTAVRAAIIDGLGLWNLRGDLFPSLQFCESVSVQIQELLHGDPMLQPILRRLLELENFCKGWQEGPFNHKNIPCIVTPESAITLSMYGQERTFLCPDGKERIFKWHVRLTPKAWRLYFHPEEETRQLIIGYIGPHLHTKEYHT